MTSCEECLDVAEKPGKYKIMDSPGLVGYIWSVDCQFDTDGAGTLVHSYREINVEISL